MLVRSVVCVCVCLGACVNNSFPVFIRDTWYSIDQGVELHTKIEDDRLTNEQIASSRCHDMLVIQGSTDAQGHYDAKYLIYNEWVMLDHLQFK